MDLRPCPSCARHIEVLQASCPFCGNAVLAESSVPLERAFAGRPAALYGGPPIEVPQFDVVLTDRGPNKVAIMKLVRQITGLDLEPLRFLVANLPAKVKSDVSEAEALDLQQKLEDAGGSVVVHESR